MKGNLLMGTGRGKLGDVVARVLHGEQVFSKYQPVVHNPKSIAQMRQREMLSIATKKATELNALKAKGIDLYYSNKFGASRNIRNLVVSVSTRAQRIADMMAGKLQVPYVSANSVIGNDFDLHIRSLQANVALTDVDYSTTEYFAFGSDIPLDLNTKFGGFSTVNSEFVGFALDCSNVNIFNVEIPLTAHTVSSECLSCPKTMGLIPGTSASPAVVEGYPYAYKIPASFFTDGSFTEIMFASGLTNSGNSNGFVFASWRDNKGNLLMSKGSTQISNF